VTVRLLTGDALEVLRGLPDQSVRCCVTSPPYWGLRDYGMAGQLGLEATPAEYVARMVAVFAEVRRVLADDGTLWLNLGDSYSRAAEKGGSGEGGKNAIYLGDNYLRAQSAKDGSSDGAVGRKT
jgi:DNA modification methylase